MTQPRLFLWLLVTALLAISAARELWRGNYTLGAVLLAVPTAGWVSVLFGTEP
jgi:hypothetical protein